jgi:hypothetical protein
VEWIGGDADSSRQAAAALAESSLNVQGRTLGRLRAWAREDCLRAAAEYTTRLIDAPVPAPDPSAPLFVAGHQPQLFHPGVWAKNFVLGGLAERAGGCGLNLIVATTLCPAPGCSRRPAASRPRASSRSTTTNRDRRSRGRTPKSSTPSCSMPLANA